MDFRASLAMTYVSKAANQKVMQPFLMIFLIKGGILLITEVKEVK